MDAPARSYTSDSGSQYHHKLPNLSQPHQAILDVAESASLGPQSSPSTKEMAVHDCPSATPASTGEKRKSLRPRPSLVYQHRNATPPRPLKQPDTFVPEQQLKDSPSKMSLFNLFSKPKVEKLRGYAEQGLENPPNGFSRSNDSSAKKAEAAAQLQKSRNRVVARKAHSRATEPTPGETTAPMQHDRRVRSFDPLPLFQVWPQATKHATFEVAAITPDQTVAQRPKNRFIGSTLFASGADSQSLQITGNRDSIDSRLATRNSVRNGSVTAAHLPTKLFVLVTSGCLLQYAADGPTDRYPEKILQLGRDSAAYASDLIPGKHHVLQIAQSVDPNGVIVANSSSLLSRIGLRSQADRRAATNFLLVMPGPEELDNWMTAIREEIERQGGTRRARSGSAANKPQSDGPPKLDLRKIPSLSHRYDVRRDSTIAIVTTPSSSPVNEDGKLLLPSRHHEDAAKHDLLASPERTNHPVPAAVTEEQVEQNTRPRSGSDAHSASSSSSISVDQRRLDRLRDSTRSSHASTTATTVGSIASRTNSMSYTPPVDASREAHDSQQDYIAARAPYRNLASYSLPSRRPAAQPPATLNGDGLVPNGADSTADSPVLGCAPKRTSSRHPHTRTLSVVHSVPNLKECAARGRANDLSPRRSDFNGRPESFLGDLPNPKTWASNSVPFRTALQQSQSSPEIPNVRSMHSVSTRQLRCNSQSFSIPLRLNTMDAATQQRLAAKRCVQLSDCDIRSPIPAATTLVAKVDYKTAPDTAPDVGRHSVESEASAVAHPRRTPSGRLSLFPASLAPAQSHQHTDLRRSPSLAVSATAPRSASAQLQRPASVVVRTDRVPFLASVRATPAVPQTRSVTAQPIRSLKPSRSIATMQTAQSRVTSATGSYNLSMRQGITEDSDQAMALPRRCESPFRSASVGSGRIANSGSPLPRIDFGMPVVGLGPPAPPPKAPLPELPPNSRPASRTASRQELRSCTPIGLAVSPIEPRSHTPTMGLGIEVGGN